MKTYESIIITIGSCNLLLGVLALVVELIKVLR